MTPAEHKKVAFLRKHIAPFYRPDSPVNTKNPEYNDYIAKSVNTIRDEIHNTRAHGRLGQITKETGSLILRVDGERFHAPTRQRIRNFVNERYNTGRTDVEIKLGKEVHAEKISKEDRTKWARGPLIEITVGHMWERKVYNEFYKNKNLDNENWFVLSAQEVRVNKKNRLRLFEAKLFRHATNEVRDGYIIKTTIGKEQADIAFTASLAIERGLAILNEAIRERVIQKEDNHDQ